MGRQIGKGHSETLNGAIIDLASGTFYAARINLTSARFSVAGDDDIIKGQDGVISSFITSGNYLEATFEVLPEAASKANAFEYGCSMPVRGTAFHASGFGTAAIKLGDFTESGINSLTGSSPSPGNDTNPWFFFSGELNAVSDGKWTASWTMRRFKGIASGTEIT